MESEPMFIKVSATSRPPAVAGAIAHLLRAHGAAHVQAVGAAAVNQAVKALAVARSYLKAEERDLALVPTFVTIHIAGEEKTALRFYVECRAASDSVRLSTVEDPQRIGVLHKTQNSSFGSAKTIDDVRQEH